MKERNKLVHIHSDINQEQEWFTCNLSLLKKNKVMQFIITNSSNPCGNLRALHNMICKRTNL
jgi:hypothetical protein